MLERDMSPQERFHSYFSKSEGYKNFASRYADLLVGPATMRSESDLRSSATHAADKSDFEIEEVAKEIATLTGRALATFNLVVTQTAAKDNPAGWASDVTTLQSALHGQLFQTFHHLDVNCLRLLEAQVPSPVKGGLQKHLQRLEKKYKLEADEAAVLGLKWHAADEAMYNAWLTREYRLKVFQADGEEVCFQLYDRNLDIKLSFPQQFRTSNGLIISRFYFVIRLFRLFRHLDTAIRILELEKPNAAIGEEIDCVQFGRPETLFQTADELFAKM